MIMAVAAVLHIVIIIIGFAVVFEEAAYVVCHGSIEMMDVSSRGILVLRHASHAKVKHSGGCLHQATIREIQEKS